jgi:hypothetical protein
MNESERVTKHGLKDNGLRHPSTFINERLPAPKRQSFLARWPTV